MVCFVYINKNEVTHSKVTKCISYHISNAGTLWTASAHIITAVIGSGVLSLAWSVAQLGWITGIAALSIFSGITFYTSNLLADCYRSPVTGKRNYNYMEVVKANLGTTN